MKEIFKAPNLNEMIASVAYLLDTLRAYRNIIESGDCNRCGVSKECKPCPFCGGNGHISEREIRFIGRNVFGSKKIRMGVQVICGRCKARGGVATGTVIYGSLREQRSYLGPLREEAIVYWNERSDG